MEIEEEVINLMRRGKQMRILFLCALVIMTGSLFAEENVKQEIEFGFNYKNLDVQEAKFEEYRVIPKGLSINKYRLDFESPDYGISFTAKNVMRDDQFARFLYKRENGLSFSAWWDKTPHSLSLISRTPFSEISAGVFTLSDEIQRKLQASTTTTSPTTNDLLLDLAKNTNAVPLKLLRDSYGFDIGLPSLGDVGFKISANRENKSGTKAIGGTLGFFTIELPEPVDYETTKFSLDTSLTQKNWNVDLAYEYSLFHNKVTEMTWDNPKRLTDQASASGYSGGTNSKSGRTSLYPDNTQHMATFNVNMLDLPLNSYFHTTLSYALLTQNAIFLPYTINTAIVPGSYANPTVNAYDPTALPVSSLNGNRGIFNQSYILSSRPWDSLGTRVGYRSEVVSNKTVEIVFPGKATADQNWSSSIYTSKVYSPHRQNLDVDIDMDVFSNVTASAGGGLEIMERTKREVEKTKESVLRGTLVYRPVSSVSVRAGYILGLRRMDDFEISDYKNSAGDLIELPGLRRVDVADRDRNEVKGTVQWTDLGGIGLSLAAFNRDYKYKPGIGDLTGGIATNTNYMYGILESSAQGGTVSADWMLDETFDISLLYDIQNVKSTERSNVSGAVLTQDAANDWTATNNDIFHTFGVDMNFSPLSKLGLIVGYNYSIGKGKITVSDIPGTTNVVETDPADTKSALQELAIRPEYTIGEGLVLVGGYILTIFDVEDFAVENVPVVAGLTAAGVSSPNAIFLGDSLRDFTAHVGYIGLKYNW